MNDRVKCILRRCGVGGVIFFTLKGLLWLTVPALIALLARE
jgi:hypothetical protein